MRGFDQSDILGVLAPRSRSHSPPGFSILACGRVARFIVVQAVFHQIPIARVQHFQGLHGMLMLRHSVLVRRFFAAQ